MPLDLAPDRKERPPAEQALTVPQHVAHHKVESVVAGLIHEILQLVKAPRGGDQTGRVAGASAVVSTPA
jgi:hypothetical protein